MTKEPAQLTLERLDEPCPFLRLPQCPSLEIPIKRSMVLYQGLASTLLPLFFQKLKLNLEPFLPTTR